MQTSENETHGDVNHTRSDESDMQSNRSDMSSYKNDPLSKNNYLSKKRFIKQYSKKAIDNKKFGIDPANAGNKS